MHLESKVTNITKGDRDIFALQMLLKTEETEEKSDYYNTYVAKFVLSTKNLFRILEGLFHVCQPMEWQSN
jgi:hypothetical protein